jgi:hypothetical protein
MDAQSVADAAGKKNLSHHSLPQRGNRADWQKSRFRGLNEQDPQELYWVAVHLECYIHHIFLGD